MSPLFRTRGRSDGTADDPVPELVREEIYGPDRLALHARRLAERHQLDRRDQLGAPVIDRLDDNEAVLEEAHRTLAAAVRRDEAVSPAAEWLLDNFHVIDEQIRVAREGLPEGYQRQLPKLANGDLEGHPRAYGLAREYVAHTDSRFDPSTLERYVSAYQEASTLSMGEVWALPSSLRLVLVENLRRLAERLVRAREARAEAQEVAAAVREAVETESDVLEPLRSRALGPEGGDRIFLVELVQRLREADPAAAPALGWLEDRIARSGLSVEELVRREHGSQLADQATVANVVTGMRKISAFAWRQFFENVSVVEEVLRRDPAGVYPRMDFATRDQYRHTLEELARGTGLSEREVARRLLARVEETAGERRGDPASDDAQPGPRHRFLGYHLTGDGRRAFEEDLGYRVPFSRRLHRAFVAGAYPGYFSTLALLTLALLALPLAWAAAAGAGTWALVAVGLAALIPATDLAIAILHQDITELVPPRRLPKLELPDGVPEEMKTLVAVPVLLDDEEDVREQVERLEERYLASSSGHLAFALLSDWADAPEERMPGDEALLGAAAEAVSRLNERYGPAPDGRSRFLLLHRHRVWSESEGRWMGWERKRGKLEELNRLLRGDRESTYLLREDGLTDLAPDVRFVLTLDADTRLPPGAARRLVGAAAHPLNRARYDPEEGRVTEGYGILQPRITAVMPREGEASLFHRLYSGPTGIDPYSSAASDVYQDLFGEGTFVGKGIYDVDAFQASLEGRVPEGALLSHDHFEGAFARCGLVSDIELFDDFPSHFEVHARRSHRWARGDWQLLPWIVGAADVEDRDVPAAPPFLGRWKMIDNLRRTLSAPSALVLLLLGWMVLPVPALLWTAFVVATVAVPAAVPVMGGFLPRHWATSLGAHLRGILREARGVAARAGLEIVFLTHRAWIMTDAVARTLTRLLVTRRNLLEWTPVALAGRGLGGGVAGSYRRGWPAVAIAGAGAALVAVVRPAALPVALPLAALWAASPLVSWWLSRPLRESEAEELAGGERRALRRAARESWRFFEETVDEESSWLPPDNLQEDPDLRVAHRTSPTNVGMYLLSTVAARDLGWIGTAAAVERMERVMESLERLERVRGHFLNWYDTRSLMPLEPRYVSTVDSGNLAGHLLAVAEACREMREGPVGPGEAAAGLRDAVGLARRALDRVDGRIPGGTVSAGELRGALLRIEGAAVSAPEEAEAWAGTLREMEEEARTLEDAASVAAEEMGGEAGASLAFWTGAVGRCISSHLRDAGWPEEGADGDDPAEERAPAPSADLDRRLRILAGRADALAREMDFGLLYDRERKLFSIGYRPEADELDDGYYDLLASEARVASLVAVATGDVETEHWFHLGRSVTRVPGGAALLSWSGSMFEYLMPHLIMDPPPGTMLERTQRLVVRRQIEYGRERGVPWGISESAYNARDLEMTYQYSHFGVPGLGLTRGLADDLVVAPYATALAAMVAPASALENFRELEATGARGGMGFYEAVDYTPSRLSADADRAVVRAYMTHHQGMIVTALANVLQEGRFRERFHEVPMIRSVEMLLQERIPRDVVPSRPRREETDALSHVREISPPVTRRFTSPHRRPPATHVLSNGRYHVMLTAAGSGYSRCGDLAVTRWREDPAADPWGTFIYLRDVDSGEVWSAGWQPTGTEPDAYEAVFSEGRAEIRRRDGAISTTMEVLVSPEEDGELRRVTIRNQGSRPRTVEVTSYAEVVLATPEADRAHPAFRKLFVETEFDPRSGALLATRRRRSPDDDEVWASHVAAVEGEAVGTLQYETDRARFLDRGRSVRAPAAVTEGRPLSNTTGSVLDPVFSLRRTLRIRPGGSARITFTTQVTDTREEARNRAEVHRDPVAFDRAAGLAWTQAQVQLQHLGVDPDEAHLFQRLASRLLYLDPALRPESGVLSRNGGGQSDLWRHGISGDRPIVVVRIAQVRDRELVRQLVRAHEYWGWKGIGADLVVLNEHPVTYTDELGEWIGRLIRGSHLAGDQEHRPHGDIHLLRAEDLDPADRDLLQSVARAVLHARDGSLSEQLAAVPAEAHASPPPARRPSDLTPEAPPRHADLSFFNGLGGFADDGRQYVITLGEGQWTPAPWVNVVANDGFGFVATEAGSGYTWSVNSRENRLTPWSNDPVGDPPGETLYVRDEVTGDLWTPTPLPIREDTPYRITHSQGWTRYEHVSREVQTELTQFVPVDDSVKLSVLRLRNGSGRVRHLSVTAYAEWVLGVDRAASAPHVRTWRDEETGALFARNGWSREFAGRVAFADLAGEQEEWTTDRTEFLGRNGTAASPAGLAPGRALSGEASVGGDPCAALRRPVRLAPGEEVEVVFLLGQGEDADGARALVERYRGADPGAVLEEVRTRWDDVLATVQVDVPDASMGPMLNRWLQYQTLSCRLFARSAFYQSGGAYGFRDQLQDVMALTVSRRDLARGHLLRAAAHQFPEGDVLHWWHPPSGRGVRTRISDDLLWLPLAAIHYLEVTGDEGVLDEDAPFLDGPELEEGEQERYLEPSVSGETASLYEHCARAVDARLETGSHGLPLMGAGDWNDGMNRVGHRGRGESVWMGWFLHRILDEFAPVAEDRGEEERARRWREHRDRLQEALERHGWDGDWYRRAYFDDGTPLGSAANEECRIDSIAQSWAVMSGAARPARQRRAMQSVEQHLVRRGDAMVLLFTPPFDDGPMDPGYIRGYVPGVRENGGQYTHAAIWSVIAFAELGQGDAAAELFSILNPVNQASTRAGVHRYKVEPYVSVGDVYSEPPHTGRGGWSWYTGSAGWMYRAGVEWILGFRLRGDVLRLDPCIPRDWPGFSMTFRYHSSRYEIEVESPGGAMTGVAEAELDGRTVRRGAWAGASGEGGGPRRAEADPRPRIDDEGAWIPLRDDGETHRIRVLLGGDGDDPGRAGIPDGGSPDGGPSASPTS